MTEHQTSLREHVHEVQEVVSTVFISMLETHPHPLHLEWRARQMSTLSVVHIAGPWNGIVMLECALAEACAFTEVLAAIPRPTTLDETVRDALGELVNTIAGNLKGILPSGVRFGISCVVEGRECQIWFKDSEPVCRLAFECEFGIFWLHLLEIRPVG